MAREIRFLTGVSPYQAGEGAIFDDDVAETYVQRRMAQYANRMVTAAPVTRDTEPEPVVPAPHVATSDDGGKPKVEAPKLHTAPVPAPPQTRYRRK